MSVRHTPHHNAWAALADEIDPSDGLVPDDMDAEPSRGRRVPFKTWKDLARLGVKPETAKALALQLDMFHDVAMFVRAPPVGDNVPVVSLQVTRQATIGTPSPNDATKPLWDANIAFTGLGETYPAAVILNAFGNDVRETGKFPISWDVAKNPNAGIGTVTCATAITGTNSWPTGAEDAVYDPIGKEFYALSPITLVEEPVGNANVVANDPFLNGFARIDGAGFKVDNVTSLLDVSGGVTYWRQPTAIPEREFQRIFATAASAVPGFQQLAWMHPAPPTSLSLAAKLPNSAPGLAKDGAYVPGIVLDPTATLRRPSNVRHGFEFQDRREGPGAQPGIIAGEGHSVLMVGGESGYGASPGGHAPAFGRLSGLASSGAYFTGLEHDATLKLTAKFWVTVAPGDKSPYVTMAQPAPPMDPMYAYYYSTVVGGLRPGWPAKFNSLGTFFKHAVHLLEEAAIPLAQTALAGFVGGPEAAVAQGAELATEALARKRVAAKRKAKKKRAKRG